MVPLRCKLRLHKPTTWNVVTFMDGLIWFYAEYCRGCQTIAHRYTPVIAFAPNIKDPETFMLKVTGPDAEEIKDILARLLDGHVHPRNIIPLTRVV